MNLNIRKIVVALSCAGLVSTAGAQGIPVYDNLGFINSIQQVMSWVKQAQDMMRQIQQFQAQIEQLQQAKNLLEGAKSLGTLLDNPAIADMLPAEFRDANDLMMQGTFTLGEMDKIRSVMAGFNVQDIVNGVQRGDLRAASSMLSRMESVMRSSQSRLAQHKQLATHSNGVADTKSSIDMLGRHMIAANETSTQIMQTLAAIEAAKANAELKSAAEQQERMKRDREDRDANRRAALFGGT